MHYPDGSSVKAGDLIWWDEGHCIGFVQAVIETEANQRKWGLRQPHISIGGHLYRPGAPGFIMCPASDFADEGIGRLTDVECAQLDNAIEHAQAQQGVDLSATDFVVHAEVRDGARTALLITANPGGVESDTTRVSLDLVDGA
jgi:hypothetical protein